MEELDLNTLEYIKTICDLYSDHSSQTLGYRRLCEIIEEVKKKNLSYVQFDGSPKELGAVRDLLKTATNEEFTYTVDRMNNDEGYAVTQWEKDGSGTVVSHLMDDMWAYIVFDPKQPKHTRIQELTEEKFFDTYATYR